MKIISIAAVTAGGKTTVVNKLKEKLNNEYTLHFDDYLFEGENGEVDMIFYDITEDDKKLIEIALSKIENNFDNKKYNHTVGAAIRCKNGNVYSGINCDGIHGSCAEYITMGIASSNGEREFDTIVAVHKDYPNKVIAPCGNCRQMLIEYCPDVKVILNDYDNNLVKVGIKDLLPFACF